MLDRFLTYVQNTPALYRVSLVICAAIIPILWVADALETMWKKEPLTPVYADLWKAFKKGAAL